MAILSSDIVPECLNTIDIDIPEVVDTDIKRDAECVTEMSLQRLWFDLYFEKQLLLAAASAIRLIPVTEIITVAPRSTRDTPMCKFVQSRTFVIVGKLHLRRYFS